jgi:hypothetical protein
MLFNFLPIFQLVEQFILRLIELNHKLKIIDRFNPLEFFLINVDSEKVF